MRRARDLARLSGEADLKEFSVHFPLVADVFGNCYRLLLNCTTNSGIF